MGLNSRAFVGLIRNKTLFPLGLLTLKMKQGRNCWQLSCGESLPKGKPTQNKAESQKKQDAESWWLYLSSWIQPHLKLIHPWTFHLHEPVKPGFFFNLSLFTLGFCTCKGKTAIWNFLFLFSCRLWVFHLINVSTKNIRCPTPPSWALGLCFKLPARYPSPHVRCHD